MRFAVVLLAVTLLISPGNAQQFMSRSAELSIKVPSFEVARTSAIKFARDAGGEAKDARTQINAKGSHSGWIRLTVPAESYESTLTSLRALGKVASERRQATDHRGEIEELKLRAKRLEEHSIRLRGMLSSGRRMRASDILFLQERVLRVNVDHDLLLKQANARRLSGESCSIVLTLFEPLAQPPVSERGFRGQVVGAWNEGVRNLILGLTSTGLWLVERAITLILWIPILLIVRHFWKKWAISKRLKALVPAWPERTPKTVVVAESNAESGAP